MTVAQYCPSPDSTQNSRTLLSKTGQHILQAQTTVQNRTAHRTVAHYCPKPNSTRTVAHYRVPAIKKNLIETI